MARGNRKLVHKVIRYLLLAVLILIPGRAFAQCNGVFNPGYVCANPGPSAGLPSAVAQSSLIGVFGGRIIVGVRSVNTSPVTVSATTDYFLCVDPTSAPITVNLPATPQTGLSFLIKDCTGKSSINAITVTPASGNIDGAVNSVISIPYQSIAVTYTGAQWSLN